jgi:hypothetical protein
MRMRFAMVSRRRSSVGEGVGGMGGSWRCGCQCWGGVGRGVALVRGGTQVSQAAMSARDRLRPVPLPGVPTFGGGKVTV